MKNLLISPDLDALPMAAVTQKFAALGISGSGKTYGVGKFVETLLDAGAQVVIVDTVGNWGQGLRLAADGKKPGIAIPILGGEHGDVPLDVTHGKLAAATVVETLSSLVLDVSDFAKAELARFVPDFATELLVLKKRNKSPLMIVWEECQDVVPQGVRGDVARMVGAVEKLVKKGRNYGVGTVLISQRAAAVNKDVLNQVETLFAFRQNSKHDRAAVSDWVVSQSIDVKGLAEGLPTLKTGECFCWSPSWLGVLKKIKFGKKRTFDASKTPDMSDYVKPGDLAPVDLAKFTATMQEAIERAAKDDPKALRARIAELEQQLEDGATKVAEPTTVEVPVFDDAGFAELRATARLAGQKMADDLTAAGRALDEAMQAFSERMRALAAERASKPISTHDVVHRDPKPAKAKGNGVAALFPSVPKARPAAGIQTATNGAGAALPSGELAVLTAIAQTSGGCTREHITVLTGYKKSYRDLILQKLARHGFVLRDGDRETVTPAGRKALPAGFEPLPTGAALREYWLKNLPGGEAELLKHAVKAHPKPVPRDRLSELTGYKKSYRDLCIQKLTRRRLVGVSTAGVVASAELF